MSKIRFRETRSLILDRHRQPAAIDKHPRADFTARGRKLQRVAHQIVQHLPHDQRITDDINDVLTDDPYVDASDIEVAVTKGDVTITGMVDSKGLKRRVEDLVEEVSGVRNVENRLKLRFPGGQIVNIRNAEGKL